MKTDATKSLVVKDPSQDQENIKGPRRTLKVLQQSAGDKENLVGRSRIEKDFKLAADPEKDIKRKKVQHKLVQTESTISVEDLTSECEPSEEYWKKLAEKRQEALNDSLIENERLKDDVSTLQEENKICKQMLEESQNLVEVLQEMLDEPDDNIEEHEEAFETS